MCVRLVVLHEEKISAWVASEPAQVGQARVHGLLEEEGVVALL